jgi:hypothetical protein
MSFTGLVLYNGLIREEAVLTGLSRLDGSVKYSGDEDYYGAKNRNWRDKE